MYDPPAGYGMGLVFMKWGADPNKDSLVLW